MGVEDFLSFVFRADRCYDIMTVKVSSMTYLSRRVARTHAPEVGLDNALQ